jgi:hypothetical protein
MYSHLGQWHTLHYTKFVLTSTAMWRFFFCLTIIYNPIFKPSYRPLPQGTCTYMVHSATHLVPRGRTSDSLGHRMSKMYTFKVYNSFANQQKEKKKEQQAFPSNQWPICCSILATILYYNTSHWLNLVEIIIYCKKNPHSEYFRIFTIISKYVKSTTKFQSVLN